MAGTLLVVATPIGNLEDLTPRAARALVEADLVVAEDVRVTKKLLAHLGARTRIESVHAHSRGARVEAVAREVAGGATVALVTDAGAPGVSDPGAALVRAVVAAGGRVVAVPGPSAVTAAASVSALCEGGYRFVGFLPRKGTGRRETLAAIARSELATILFESPNRTSATLRDLVDAAGPDRAAVVCRELTKVHEEIAHGTLETLALRFAGDVRGEVTIVVGAALSPVADQATDPEEVLRAALDAGVRPSEAARAAASLTGITRAEAYAIALRLKR
jgi:16S rRNA (cytidine1402-2'-O)-methyltransferase